MEVVVGSDEEDDSNEIGRKEKKNGERIAGEITQYDTHSTNNKKEFSRQLRKAHAQKAPLHRFRARAVPNYGQSSNSTYYDNIDKLAVILQ